MSVIELTDLCCDECGHPHFLDTDTGWAEHAATPECCAWGLAVPLWWLLDRAGTDRNPRGRDRPVCQGRPVPWLTPVTTHGPHWRLIHRGRLAAAQRYWLCQVCGLPITDEEAMLVVDAAGWCLTSAPLHSACVTLSAACPAITRRGTIRAISSGQLHRTGDIAPELGRTQRWRLTGPDTPDRADPPDTSRIDILKVKTSTRKA